MLLMINMNVLNCNGTQIGQISADDLTFTMTCHLQASRDKRPKDLFFSKNEFWKKSNLRLGIRRNKQF